MSDERKETEGTYGPVKRLLRHWGAREALKEAETAPPHEDRARATPRFPRIYRAVKIAALVMVILSMAAYITGLLTLDRATQADRLQAEFDAKVQELRAENDRLVAERDNVIKEREAELARLQELCAENEPIIAERNRIIKEREAELARLQARCTELAGLLQKTTPGVAPIKNETRAAYIEMLKEQGADVLAEKLGEAWNQLESVRSATALELGRLNTARREAESACERAENQEAALRLANADARAMLRELYVGPATPGIEARQAAAREHDLLGRYKWMKDSITDDDTLSLCDAVDAALTRLDSLSPTDKQQAKSFAESVRESDLVGQIDAVLGSDEAPAAVRSWLLEAQLILMDKPGE